MRHMLNVRIEVVCETTTILQKVMQNREKHAGIVAEAREGFLKKAKEVLEAEMGKLKEGKLKTLSVQLQPPADHTSEYDTVIQMLQLHTEDTITLDADGVRMFVEDKWDWTEAFLGSNAHYSGTARAILGG